jgi:hypothetical protein
VYASEAVCERQFSLCTMIQSKTRNRLAVPRLSRSLIIRSYLLDRENRKQIVEAMRGAPTRTLGPKVIELPE